MTALALAIAVLPFIESMSVNAKQENDAWGACNVADLVPGDVKRCGRFSIYRRTPKDRSVVQEYIHLLADPGSAESEQSDTAKNEWRSENPEYFVFLPWAPERGCGVQLVTTGPGFLWDVPEAAALKELPFFTEPCEARAWDTSGRLYHRRGYPPERNLTVPKVRWMSDSEVLVYGG